MNKGCKYFLIFIGIMQSQAAFGMMALWTKQKTVEQAESKQERKDVRESGARETPYTKILEEEKSKQEYQASAGKNVEANLSFEIARAGTRPLIILFDPDGQEKGEIGAITMTLNTALSQEYAPIIASTTLLESPKRCSKWHTFQTPDKALLVFLPKTSYDEFFNNRTQEDTMIKYGIKLKGLEHIEAKYFVTQPTAEENSTDLKAYLKDILVTHNDLKEMKAEDAFVTWDIYLSGHGGLAEKDMEATIAGLPLENFKQFLQFLNTGINTRSLLYDTCYSGGKHLKLPYQHTSATPGEEDTQKLLQEKLKNQEHDLPVQDTNLKFMIISSTIFERPTSTSQEKSSTSSTQFSEYFSSLNQYFEKPGSITLSQVLDYASEWRKSYDPNKRAWLQFPTVRFPNTGWFVLPEMDNTVLIIDDAAVRRAQASKAQEIKVGKTVKMIILDTHNIPVKVTFEGDSMPLFVPSKVETTNFYSFQEIYAPNIYLIAGPNTSGTQDNPKIDVKTMLEMVDEKLEELKYIVDIKIFIKRLTINLDDKHALEKRDASQNKMPFTRANICSDISKCSDPKMKQALIFNDIELDIPMRIGISSEANPNFDLLGKNKDSLEEERFRYYEWNIHDLQRSRLKKILDEYLQLQDKPELLKQWKEKLEKKDREWLDCIISPTQEAFTECAKKGREASEKAKDGYAYSYDISWSFNFWDKVDKKRKEELVRKYLQDMPVSLDEWKEISKEDKAWLSVLIDPKDDAFQAMKIEAGYHTGQWLEKLRESIKLRKIR